MKITFRTKKAIFLNKGTSVQHDTIHTKFSLHILYKTNSKTNIFPLLLTIKQRRNNTQQIPRDEFS